MKICHITSKHKRFDGRIFQKECKSLSKAGYDVTLIVADGIGSEKRDEIKICDVGIGKLSLLGSFKKLKKIKKIAKELDCKVYHFHDPELIFVGLSLKRRGKKVIFDMHENIPAYISERQTTPIILRHLLAFL